MGLGTGLDRGVAAGEHRDAGLAREPPRGDLVAEQVEQLGPRADEHDPGPLAGPGELGVLGEEAVARVDRVDVLRLGQRDDRLDVQIAADRLAGLADLVRLVGLEPVHREPVFVRVDRHGADAQLVGRAKDPDGDLAAVGDQQLAKLGHRAIPWIKEPVDGRRAAARGGSGWVPEKRERGGEASGSDDDALRPEVEKSYRPGDLPGTRQ